MANFGGNCGYYAVRNGTLYGSNITQTFLVLNTNLYHPKNLKNVDKVDPCNQLQWLDEQLRKSTGDERVFIVAHIPPGMPIENYQSRKLEQSTVLPTRQLRVLRAPKKAPELRADGVSYKLTQPNSPTPYTQPQRSRS